jgi:hypothetical protein
VATHANEARADALGDRLDPVALACGVAPFKEDDHPQTLFRTPVLRAHNSTRSVRSAFSYSLRFIGLSA